MKSYLSIAAVLFTLLCTGRAVAVDIGVEIDEDASVSDSSTGVMGVSHIVLSVRDLEAAVSFYAKATGFPIIAKTEINAHASHDALYNGADLNYSTATFKAPNMLFQLIEFAENQNTPVQDMPPQGPGMTHTCFQSPIEQPGFDRFDAAGARTISFGGGPVDLGGYGVTYAYAYDPEGNMIELEQLDGKILERAGYDNTWAVQNHSLWMSQVALATHDLKRLMEFYQEVLGYKPYRVAELKDNKKADAIAGINDLDILGGWFRLNRTSKVLELWQYRNPETPHLSDEKTPRSLGYSYLLEVKDIHAQHVRLKELGVFTFSAPIVIDGAWQFFARDIDGNVFGMRQVIDPESPYSVTSLDVVAR